MTRSCARAWRATAIAILVALTTAHAGVAQTAPTLEYGSPDDAGMSAAVLDAALGIYQEAVDRGDLVGAVVLVARNGTVVLHEAVGMSDAANGVPMARNTLFQMASNTKPVVATAIGMMVADGRLDPAEPVRTHLAEWDNYRAGFITPELLLSHTSGLRIGSLFLPGMADDTDLVREARRFGEVGATTEPGAYSYSNPGYNTLGALLELLSGEALEAHLDRVLYTPLGMDDSYNYRADHPLGGKRDRLGPMYYQRDEGEWVPGQAYTIPFARASGGMISTAWDYAVFLQTMLNGGAYGDVRVLPEEVVAIMTRDHVEGPEGYGFGWSVPDGYEGWGSGPGYFGHSGSDGTDAFADPETGLVALVFTQTPRGRPPFSRFRELVKLAIEPGS
ncbi:MAG TPA: serine hydrolase domain-containing protein [Longimicrobiales bacterium]|nr:serine hydrolase domain-containing protein [Longimicrobiales bacterium]